MENNKEANKDDIDGIQRVSTFRRILPQFLGSLAKNLMAVNVGQFFGLLAILIPALTGLNTELNPNETLRITADQASWLPSFADLTIPIGALLGAPISDAIGRLNAMIISNIVMLISWVALGFSQEYWLICAVFTLFGLSNGFNNPPLAAYGNEICEPSIRGTMMSFGVISFISGIFISMAFGAIFTWRQVSIVGATLAVISSVTLLMLPESPHWLMSKDRYKDAQKSLQWLRGWVSPQTIHKEFNELQNYSNTATACEACMKQSTRCYHSKPTFWEKMRELKQRRNMLPLTLIFFLQIFSGFSLTTVWDPYIIQVLNAFEMPIKPNFASVLTSCAGILGCVLLILTVKKFGRRKIYFTSVFVIVVCCFGLGAYGFIFFPAGMISFNVNPGGATKNPELIANSVGNYGYLALILILIMKFFGKFGTDTMFAMYMGEVFPFKLRSFMCGISISINFLLSAVASKTYYNIELWLSLPGAIIFYGIIDWFVVMYFIMPETEQRSLEDIERHYSQNAKGLTDIHIRKQTESIENI